MLRNVLPEVLAADFSLICAFLTWMVLIVWLWTSGWKVQRRYFIEATLTPYQRNGIVWMCALVGFVVLIAAQFRPAAPAIVGVAMIGTLTSIVDARTHRLPDRYTQVMAVTVVFGVGCALLTTELNPWTIALQSCAGALIWGIPVLLLNSAHRGMGFGDVKLAPVLGFMLGSVGYDCAIGGLLLSLVSAGFAAVWRLIVGAVGLQNRMPMGPWFVGGAIVADIMWGILPDWV